MKIEITGSYDDMNSVIHELASCDSIYTEIITNFLISHIINKYGTKSAKNIIFNIPFHFDHN